MPSGAPTRVSVPPILARAISRCIADMEAAKGGTRDGIARRFVSQYGNDLVGVVPSIARITTAKTLRERLTAVVDIDDVDRDRVIGDRVIGDNSTTATAWDRLMIEVTALREARITAPPTPSPPPLPVTVDGMSYAESWAARAWRDMSDGDERVLVVCGSPQPATPNLETLRGRYPLGVCRESRG